MRFYAGSIMMLVCALAMVGCSDSDYPAGRPAMISLPPMKAEPVYRSMNSMAREVNVRSELVSSGKYCRRKPQRLNQKYITIHSTANMTADAMQHAKALKNGRIRGGKIGYLSWHFTVDDRMAVQHLPLTEVGHHADFGGPGNRNSFGIEMCEHRGNDMIRTFERTAKLTAILMKRYNIPLQNVVPHYYWTRKNCPRPLLDNGAPGYRWSWFVARVDYYRRCLAMTPKQG